VGDFPTPVAVCLPAGPFQGWGLQQCRWRAFVHTDAQHEPCGAVLCTEIAPVLKIARPAGAFSGLGTSDAAGMLSCIPTPGPSPADRSRPGQFRLCAQSVAMGLVHRNLQNKLILLTLASASKG
jgi:hypothetical protein